MKNNDLKNILKIYIKSHFVKIIIGILLMLVSVLFSLYAPILLQRFIDNIRDMNARYILTLLGCVVGMLVFESVYKYIFSMVGLKTAMDIREKAWNQALMKNVSWYHTNHSGEVSSRIMNDASVLISFLAEDTIEFLCNLCMIIGSLVMMFLLDPIITVIFLAVIPLILLTVKPISNMVYGLSEQKSLFLAQINSYFVETIGHIKMVKAYGKEEYEAERGKKKFQDIFQLSKKNILIQSILTPIMGAIAMALVLIVIIIGSLRVNYGAVTAGSLIAIVMYVFTMLQPIQDLGSFFVTIETVKGTTKNLLTILEDSGEILIEGELAVDTENLRFHEVSFQYESADKLVLDKITFEIKKGEKVALIGESGAGKSTIFSLIERFYEPSQGNIYVGKKKCQKYSLESWRKMFGYVSQESPLISGTIKDNILYGVHRKVSEEEIDHVIKEASLSELIDTLPKGLDTKVGEAGGRLSGGEKQRIAIARAMLRNPQYLLLDEATANLDIESEEKIQDAISKLYSGKTTIVIAHKLATVLNANKVIVLENGKVTGVGSHKELYQCNEYYKKIFHKQFEHEIEKGEMVIEV